MRTKRVNRYYCDFCKKAGQSKPSMERHESGCTLNPNRVCRVCKMDRPEFARGEARQRPIAELLALLPAHSELFEVEGDYANGYFPPSATPVVNAALPALREACGNCPACILAALRQAKIPVPVATDFDFTAEMKKCWDSVNEAMQEKAGW